MKLVIQNPQVKKMTGTNNVKVSVVIKYGEGECNELWYIIPSQFEDYLSYEVADAYVVAFLLYAMQRNLDIETDMPVSSRLLAMLNKYLVPFICEINEKMHPIQIFAKESNEVFKGSHCGTGISCGVDSLSTVVYHGIDETINNRRLDTLTLLNTGYYGHNNGNSEHYKSYIHQSEQFCKEFGFGFLTVDSNVSNLTQYDFLSAHTYLTCSTILLLQKYFRLYYYASGYPVYDFEANFKDPAYYDTFLLNCISTESLEFLSSCCIFSRVKKTSVIAKHPDIIKHLYVCLSGDSSHNCSCCEKCIRTMLALEAIGETDTIKEIFDYSIYKKNRNRYFSYMLRHKKNNPYYREIFDEMKRNKRSIPFLAYINIIPCSFELSALYHRFKGILNV